MMLFFRNSCHNFLRVVIDGIFFLKSRDNRTPVCSHGLKITWYTILAMGMPPLLLQLADYVGNVVYLNGYQKGGSVIKRKCRHF